jgi:hypothetical protein
LLSSPLLCKLICDQVLVLAAEFPACRIPSTPLRIHVT